MELFIIGYGLGGGFGGIQEYEVIETTDLNDANKWAYENACELYEGYAGMYGLRDLEDIMDEDECNEEDAQIIYEEERESWLEYIAVPYSKEYEKKLEGEHYTNRYTDITDKLD